MLGIQQITQEVNKKSKLNNQKTTKKVLNAFLETIQQKLVQGESLNFKGYFSNDFKQANKGKGVQFYAKSDKFRNLVQDTRNCKDCQKKKQDLIKSAKLTNRINFKPSKEFWIAPKSSSKKK